VGVCVYVKQSSSTVECINLDGSARNAPAGLGTLLDDNDGSSFGGLSFEWKKSRTFFASGRSNRVMCWDWTTNDGGQACPDGSVLETGDSSNGTRDGAEPYAFAQVTDGCLIGLGDRSEFFSFDPEGFTPCVDAKLRTPVLPCICDGGENRWGAIRMPTELLNQVETLYGTIRATDAADGAIVNGLANIPLHTNGGLIDLSGVDPSIGQLWLELDVDAKLVGGQPAWQDPIEIDLEIVVQPTLTE